MNSKRKKYCGIPACINNRGITSEDVQLFRTPIPSDIPTREKWAEKIQNLFDIELANHQLYICSNHFDPNDMKNVRGKKVLKSGAVPTIASIVDIKSTAMEMINTCEAFNFIDINAIKTEPITDDKNTTISMNHSTKQPLQCNNVKLNESKCCSQCIEYFNENVEIREKYEKLLEQNNRLRAQLKLLMKNNKEKVKAKREHCQICHVFLTSDELLQHLCLNQNEIVCEYCEMVFTTTIDFGNHLSKANHSFNVYRCDGCSMGFLTAVLLKFHKESKFTHFNRINDLDVSLTHKIYKCALCDLSFKFSNELRAHVKENHSNEKFVNSFECYICKVQLKTKKDAGEHIKKLHARDQKCTVCEEYLTFAELSQHICIYGESIMCEYCENSFDVTGKLVAHLDTHDARTMYQCHKCPKYFAMSQLRNWHEKQHKDQQKSFICEVCSKGYIKKSHLQSHMRTHRTKINCLCAECGRGFSSEYSLRRHSIVHTKKELQCPDCPQVFNKLQMFNDHREVHQNLKYKCNECGSTYSTKRNLVSHISRVHTNLSDKKKVGCTLCSMKFHNSNKLVIHMRKHTGEKPFACEFCPDKRYAYKQDLIKHMQTHFGNEFYKCNSCDKGFRLYTELRRHSYEHYKIKK